MAAQRFKAQAQRRGHGFGGIALAGRSGAALSGQGGLIFCASPGYLARRGMPRSLEELWTHAAVTYGRADGGASLWLIPHGAGPVERRAVEGCFVVGQADALVESVLAHSGIAQLATWLVDEHLASGRLVQILPDLETDGLALHLVWPRSRQLLPKVDGLISYLGSGLGIR